MKVCVFGAGAIGGHLAMRLVRGGADVSVVARGPHLAAIQQHGLTVRASDGEHTVRVAASDDPAALGAQDAVLVTVKAPALPAVATSIPPLLKPGTSVTFAMNGIPWWYFHAHGGPLGGQHLPLIDPDDRLWASVGPERALGGVVYSAATVTQPGVIEVENPNSRLIIGEPDGSRSARVEELAAMLNAGGIVTDITPVIRDAIWNKLIGNLASGTLAILGRETVQRLYSDATLAETARRLMEEAAKIALALGCRPDLDHDRRLAHGRTLAHKPSILQDLELGRPMEIDGIFEVPLELARLVGVATPTLDLLVTLSKTQARAAGLYPT
jgi:2-dehydropantoate 2-reductase